MNYKTPYPLVTLQKLGLSLINHYINITKMFNLVIKNLHFTSTMYIFDQSFIHKNDFLSTIF